LISLKRLMTGKSNAQRQGVGNGDPQPENEQKMN